MRVGCYRSTVMPHRSRGPVDLLTGFWLPVRGAGLVLGHASLVALSVVPVLLTVFATIASVFAVYHWGHLVLWARPDPGAVSGFLSSLWAWLGVAAWWVGQLGVWLVSAAIAVVVARVLSAPVMDVLAQKSLKMLNVEAPEGVQSFGDLPLTRSVPLSLVRAAFRGLVFLTGLAVLTALSFLPGVATFTTPLTAAWTMAWLFVDTSLYALQWVGDADLPDVKRLVRARPWASVGFAFSSGLMLTIPLVGFFLTPAAVVGACVLVAQVQRESRPPSVLACT